MAQRVAMGEVPPLDGRREFDQQGFGQLAEAAPSLDRERRDHNAACGRVAGLLLPVSVGGASPILAGGLGDAVGLARVPDNHVDDSVAE